MSLFFFIIPGLDFADAGLRIIDFDIRILLNIFTNFSVLVCFLSWKVLSSSLSYENKQFMVFSFPGSTSNMMVSSFFYTGQVKLSQVKSS